MVLPLRSAAAPVSSAALNAAAMARVFDSAQAEVCAMLENDSFGRFKRSDAGQSCRDLWDPTHTDFSADPLHGHSPS